MHRKRSHSEVSSSPSTTSEDKYGANNENKTVTAFVDSIGTDMVDIHVGRDEDRKLFRLHKKRICVHSSYFNDCFENGKRVTRLSNESPKLFDVMSEWVYTGKLRSFRNSISHSESYSLYQLAELLVVPVAMDRIITLIRHRHYEQDFYIGAGSVEDIYVNTCWNSQLRAYAIELFVYTLRGDTDENEEIISNRGLLSLLKVTGFTHDFIKLSQMITIEDPRESGCRFHVHEEDDVCGEKEENDACGNEKYVEKADGDDEDDEDENATDSNEERDEVKDEDGDEEDLDA